MNPLAIALQGVGFGALLVAVQGFAVVEVVTPTSHQAGSGSGPAWLNPVPFVHRPRRRPRMMRERNFPVIL